MNKNHIKNAIEGLRNASRQMGRYQAAPVHGEYAACIDAEQRAEATLWREIKMALLEKGTGDE